MKNMLTTLVVCAAAMLPATAPAQDRSLIALNYESGPTTGPATSSRPLLESSLPAFFDEKDGTSINELIASAIAGNEELKISRIEIDRARARLKQAGLRPNPTLDFEQTSGAIVGNTGDRALTVGATLPIEIGGRRASRLEHARVEIELREAELRNRERLLASALLASYADALGALRELSSVENLLELDLQTTRFIQARVNEGDAPPLELSLFQAEVDRLRSRRTLAEAKLGGAITRLKLLAALPFDRPLKLREQLDNARLPDLPDSEDALRDLALRSRPDLEAARIDERAAAAGLKTTVANSRPTMSAYLRYSQGRTGITLPAGSFPQIDRSLTFGVNVGVPVFNKNQGAVAEAELTIAQAKERSAYAERIATAEVIAARQRYIAASRAVATLQTAALPRSMQNVDVFRRVYEIGEIRVTELLAEQRRLIDVNRDLTEAMVEKYRAQAELQTAAGVDILRNDNK